MQLRRFPSFRLELEQLAKSHRVHHFCFSSSPTSTATILVEDQCSPCPRIWQIELVFVRTWEIWGLAAESVVGAFAGSRPSRCPHFVGRGAATLAPFFFHPFTHLLLPYPCIIKQVLQTQESTPSCSASPQSCDDISPDFHRASMSCGGPQNHCLEGRSASRLPA
jgi:hypothetical protein